MTKDDLMAEVCRLRKFIRGIPSSYHVVGFSSDADSLSKKIIHHILAHDGDGLDLLCNKIFHYLLRHDGADDEDVQRAVGASLRAVGDAIDRLIAMELITRERR